MNDRSAQIEQDIALIKDVLAVRHAAFTIAFDTLSVGMYQAARDENDGEILDHLVLELKKAERELADKKELLTKPDSLHKHLHVLIHITSDEQRVHALREMCDVARANVELITSIKMLDPPVRRTTEELFANLAKLEAELKESKQA